MARAGRSRGRQGDPARDGAPVAEPRADRVRELRLRGRARGRRLRHDEQVRRGLPGPPLLRRVRERGHGGGAGRPARQGALRRRARERPAALGVPGQHGRLLHGALARRHDRRAESRARRPPDHGQPRELLREALPDRAVRGPSRGRADRSRAGARPLPGASPEAARRRRLCLPEGDRLQALPRDRRRVRVPPDDRHRAPGGAGRGGAPPEPDPVRRLRHLDHPQDAPGPARRHGHVPRGPCPGARQGRDARHAGRAADARDRGEGRRRSARP